MKKDNLVVKCVFCLREFPDGYPGMANICYWCWDFWNTNCNFMMGFSLFTFPKEKDINFLAPMGAIDE